MKIYKSGKSVFGGLYTYIHVLIFRQWKTRTNVVDSSTWICFNHEQKLSVQIQAVINCETHDKRNVTKTDRESRKKMSQNNGNSRDDRSKRPVHHQHFDNHLRQDFEDDLSMEPNSSNGARTEPRPPQKDFRILRCFCGCSPLTYEQIESYAMMNVKGIIHNEDGNKLLKTFLKIGHRSDKSNALILLECYEFCDRILGDLDAHQEHLDDLLEVCPSFLWEQKINDACDAETPDQVRHQLEEVLTALKKECVGNIESDHDFTRFRLELLRKIGK